jgi:glyoxylase-like metal-dependent hydrolase (beta-lactamase superfamily II)
MRSVRVADRVHRLTQGVVNFYLVEDGGKLTVIDAGAPGNWTFFVQTVAAQGRALHDVDAVLLTHAHSDHVGFAERARTEASSTVRIHRADADAAKTGVVGKNEAGYGRYLLRFEAYRTLFGLMRRGGLKIEPVQEVSAFEEGETLDVPGRPRVIHTPGHTRGHSCLLIEDRRVLFTGDALSTRNPLTGRLGPQIAPDGLNRDSERAMRSLDAIASLPADVLLPGHGEPWPGGAADAVRLAKAAGRS